LQWRKRNSAKEFFFCCCCCQKLITPCTFSLDILLIALKIRYIALFSRTLNFSYAKILRQYYLLESFMFLPIHLPIQYYLIILLGYYRLYSKNSILGWTCLKFLVEFFNFNLNLMFQCWFDMTEIQKLSFKITFIILFGFSSNCTWFINCIENKYYQSQLMTPNWIMVNALSRLLQSYFKFIIQICQKYIKNISSVIWSSFVVFLQLKFCLCDYNKQLTLTLFANLREFLFFLSSYHWVNVITLSSFHSVCKFLFFLVLYWLLFC